MDERPEIAKAGPPEITDAEQRALDHIAEVSKNARATWFALIGLLLFCGVTLLGVEDRDFFEYGASTQLPLVGVTVPTANFFWAAPFLVTGLYAYLHLYLDKLWRGLAALPETVGGQDLDSMVYPWMIADAAIQMRSDTPPRPYVWLTRLTILGLAWLSGPAVMVAFWVRSWAPHDEWLTSTIGLQLVVTISLALFSIGRVTLLMRERDPDLRVFMDSLGDRALWGFALFIPLYTILNLGWAKTEDGRYWAPPGARDVEMAYLHPANLYRARLTLPNKDWKGRDRAWREYERENRSNVVAELKRENDGGTEITEKMIADRLLEQFRADRREDRAALARRDWVGVDLRRANLQESFLAGLDLREARLEGADLSAARLEGANLRQARLEGAKLWQARLEGADLYQARLKGAHLREARLEGADLVQSQLEGANLRSARLEGAYLGEARLKGADLRLARLEGANLTGAQLEGANLRSARLKGADLVQVRLEGADLQGAWLEGANLYQARLKGADLFQARLEGANLRSARLEGADLFQARLEGANLTRAQLEGANLGEAEMADVVFQHVSVIGANLSQARQLMQTQLDAVFGDASTTIPNDLQRPVHWPQEALLKAERYARWRDWALSVGAKDWMFPKKEPK